MVMFGKQKGKTARIWESYGRIIKIEGWFYLYRGLRSKYVTVEYHVNQQRYEVRQLIYSILPAHEKKLKLQERYALKSVRTILKMPMSVSLTSRNISFGIMWIKLINNTCSQI